MRNASRAQLASTTYWLIGLLTCHFDLSISRLSGWARRLNMKRHCQCSPALSLGQPVGHTTYLGFVFWWAPGSPVKSRDT